MCYLERHVREDLTVVFTAGCRSRKICNVINALGGRKRNSLVTCAQCCDAPANSKAQIPCNGYLCNQMPGGSSVKNECGQCDRVEYPTLCQTFSACRPDELCDADLKAYKTSHNPAIGKRAAVEVCSACCEGNRCNQGGCQVLVKNQTCYDKAICG
ncbi:unnamed protein product [Mytilus coruscus]|uniref:Uncharacterized protein n=1 Tax=Mytilus coruscus TaxID=42192 RepID=A0A6J8BQE5_MYTCO|nr:unnamed protein product [Mytilus coruscus]